MAIKECFGCEKLFEVEHHGQNYCSSSCESEFEMAIQSEIEESKALGLVNDEGIALSQGNPLSEVQARSIMDQFKLKVKI